MTIDIPEEMVPMIVHAFAQNPGLRGFVKAELVSIAQELKGEDDLLTPVQAAELLGVTRRTLQDNHREWGLDKEVGFGPDKPFFSRRQILLRSRSKVVYAQVQCGKCKKRIETSPPVIIQFHDPIGRKFCEVRYHEHCYQEELRATSEVAA